MHAISSRIYSSAMFGVWMRAGGRTSIRSSGSSGSFRSSGSSYRSSGGGISSGGRIGGGVFALIALVVVGLIGFAIWNKMRGGSALTSAIAGATGVAAAGAAAYAHSNQGIVPDDPGGLAEIVEKDPDFDQTSFMSAVERCFFLAQKAWCDQQPDVSRQVMADGIWQTHKTQIEEMRARGRKSVMEDMAIERCTIVSADSNANKDTIVVLVEAHAKDYEIDIASGKKVGGQNSVETWGERWTFQRKSGTKTRADGGTLSQKCPNCGAPLKVDLAGVCGYCKANVMAGEHDWVLVKIDDE